MFDRCARLHAARTAVKHLEFLFLLNVRQPVDHQDPENGHFYQQVFLVHRGYESNTLINTDGYLMGDIGSGS